VKPTNIIKPLSVHANAPAKIQVLNILVVLLSIEMVGV